MDYVIANLAPKVRRAVLNGRDYMVATGTILLEGVLSGSDGPIYYPPDSFLSNVDDWNGMPITVAHPILNGKPVSARHPKVMNEQTIGTILNARGEDGKLKVEYWFDIESTQRIDPRIYENLKNNTTMEVSTGLFAQTVKSPPGSNFMGKMYTHTVQAVKPDHLAVLPDEQGACSREAGCGVLVNERKAVVSNLIDNKLTHDDVRMSLNKLLSELYGKDDYGLTNAYLADVYDRECVYGLNGKLYKSKYRTDNRTGTVSLDADKEEVRRVISYKPVTANTDDKNPVTESNPSTKETNVNKDEMVTYLTANCECWKGEGSKEILNGFDEPRLTKLVEAGKKLNEKPAVATPVTNATPPATPAPVVTITQPTNYEDWMKLAPPQVQRIVTNAMGAEQREKADLIEKIVANTSDDKKEGYRALLNKKDNDDLRLMAELSSQAKPVVQNNGYNSNGWDIPHTTVNYQGAGATPGHVAPNPQSEPLVPPTINWEE